jgi:hypothetical protein
VIAYTQNSTSDSPVNPQSWWCLAKARCSVLFLNEVSDSVIYALELLMKAYGEQRKGLAQKWLLSQEGEALPSFT